MVRAEVAQPVGHDLLGLESQRRRLGADRARAGQLGLPVLEPLQRGVDLGQRHAAQLLRRAQEAEQVAVERPGAEQAEDGECQELGGEEGRLAPQRPDDRLAQPARDLGRAFRPERESAVVAHRIGGIDRPPVLVDARSVGQDAVAEGVERLADAQHDLGVERDEIAGEVEDTPRLRELVVVDDVPRLPRFLQVVLDERLRLEHQAVGQRAGNDEDARLRRAGAQVVDERAQAGAQQAQLELALHGARAAARAAGEEQVVVAVLQRDGRVFLEHRLVEHRLLLAVDPVGPQVVHEEREQRIVEEVQPGAVHERRQTHLEQRPAEHDRVHVRLVGRGQDHGPLLRQRAQRVDRPADLDLVAQVGQARQAERAANRIARSPRRPGGRSSA